MRVALDAGHGSNTAGKRTPDGYREHWANVMICAYQEQALKRCGIDVVRIAWDDENSKDDVDLGLTSRQQIIRAAKCDAAISNHFNAFGTGWNSANGCCTYIHSNPLNVRQSRKLATLVQEELVKGTTQKDRGVLTAAFAMCNARVMGVKAAILIEHAFMTNKAESELMKSTSYCKEQAEDTTRGVCRYFGVKYVPENGSVAAGGFELIFDAKWYAEHNADVKAAFGNNADALLNHFVMFGMKEGRQACEGFNVKTYRQKNADLEAAYGDDYVMYYMHYINIGHRENRIKA